MPQSQDMRLAEVWHADAQASLSGNPVAFVNQPQWAIDDTTVAQIIAYGPGQASANIRALKVGTCVLTVMADGVSTQTTINVLAPFDTITLTWTKQ